MQVVLERETQCLLLLPENNGKRSLKLKPNKITVTIMVLIYRKTLQLQIKRKGEKDQTIFDNKTVSQRLVYINTFYSNFICL